MGGKPYDHGGSRATFKGPDFFSFCCVLRPGWGVFLSLGPLLRAGGLREGGSGEYTEARRCVDNLNVTWDSFSAEGPGQPSLAVSHFRGAFGAGVTT